MSNYDDDDNTFTYAPGGQDQEKKIELLLCEFEYHRDSIKTMIVDLEEIKQHIDKILPKNLDARYIRFFEEKVKTITALFTSLLEMRKEIAKSVKDEIEIRRKIINKQEEFDPDELLDIRKMTEQMDKFQESTKQLKERVKRTSLEEQIEGTGIQIPGINMNPDGGKMV